MGQATEPFIPTDEEKLALVRGALRVMQFGLVHPEDLMLNYIKLAVYLGELEGRPFDVSSLATFTMLPRTTVARKLQEFGRSRRGPRITLEGKGRRQIVRFAMRTPEQKRRSDEYIMGLQKIFTESCQALGIIDQDDGDNPDPPPAQNGHI